MKQQSLFSVFGAVSLLFGLCLLIFPNAVMSLYGVPSIDSFSSMLLRFIGGIAFSMGVLSWLIRAAEASQARDAVATGLAIGNAISAIIIAWSAMSGMFNALMWVEAAIFALFAVALFVIGRANLSRT